MDNYKKLIELLKEYKKTKFWEIISGDDFFKIKDKKDIFVSVMGQEGMDNSIAVYCGKDELLSQLDTAFYEYQNSPDSYNRLGCFKICVEDSGNLVMKDDKKKLKKNKLSVDMVALKLEPGYLPRLVTEEESLFLIDVIEKIIMISKYYKEKGLTAPSDKLIDKMYVFDCDENQVSHKKVSFPKLTYKNEKTKKLDQDLVNKTLIFKQKGTYEVGLMYSPFYLDDEKNYPYVIIVFDNENGLIIDVKLTSLDNRSNFQNELLSIFEKKKIYPKNLSFNGTDVLYLCKDLIQELKVNFRVNPNSEQIFEIWTGMYKGLGK